MRAILVVLHELFLSNWTRKWLCFIVSCDANISYIDCCFVTALSLGSEVCTVPRDPRCTAVGTRRNGATAVQSSTCTQGTFSEKKKKKKA